MNTVYISLLLFFTATSFSAEVLSYQAKLNRALYSAASQGDMKGVVRSLARGANIDGNCSNEETPLLAAARSRHASIVSLLLSCNADPNKVSQNRVTCIVETPLHQCTAIRSYKMYPCLVYLLRCGANPSITTDTGWDPLTLAAEYNCEETVKILLKYGAENEVKRPYYATAYSRAYSHTLDRLEYMPLLKILKEDHLLKLHAIEGTFFSVLPRELMQIMVAYTWNQGV